MDGFLYKIGTNSTKELGEEKNPRWDAVVSIPAGFIPETTIQAALQQLDAITEQFAQVAAEPPPQQLRDLQFAAESQLLFDLNCELFQ